MMARLSNLTALSDRYGVIVVGSGYGGAITAARLAKAGANVCMLERGREWPVGAFPDTSVQMFKALRTRHNPLGLYDYLATDDVDVFTGSGLGGTSLINANVLLKPDDDVFDHARWPEAIRIAHQSGELQQYYDAAFDMLDGSRAPAKLLGLRKVRQHEHSGRNRPGRFTPLDLAVHFTFPSAPNNVGITQPCCTLCGDCVTGCNVGAKNTLAMNYLPVARQNGASIFTQIEVHHLTKADAGGYFVVCIDRSNEASPRTRVLHANVVILAAGALGSTQILLRSRDRGLAISAHLGSFFSANGNMLGLNYNSDHRTDVLGFGALQDARSHIQVGPAIASMIDYRNRRRPLPERFIIEEGTVPRALVDLLRYAAPVLGSSLGDDTDFSLPDEASEAARVLRDLAAYDIQGALNHSQVYLGIGHDGADGSLALDRDGAVRIHWQDVAAQPVFQTISDEMHALTEALGGTYIRNPRLSKLLGRNIVTVHPLGGCPMGPDAGSGVVDHRGRVFDPSQGPSHVHEGLLVADGAIIPTSLGENPMFTISALCERIASLLIADEQVPKTAHQGQLPMPEDASVGLEFTDVPQGLGRDNASPTPTAYRGVDWHNFWYIFATTGQHGFLLDVIQRPDRAEARLAVYRHGQSPRVLRTRFDRRELERGATSLRVSLGPFSLHPAGCSGQIGPIDIDVAFDLHKDTMDFVPAWINWLIPSIPHFTSHYGTLRQGICQGVTYQDVPLTYSTYRVGRIERSKWILVSAPQFANTDLAFEISASKLFGLWGASGYLCFQGTTYRIKHPIANFFRFRVQQGGSIVGDERRFTLSVHLSRLTLTLTARAPLSEFAHLEQEGDTHIHTTLFGSCDVELVLKGLNGTQHHTYRAERTCLLEVKDDGQVMHR